MYQENKLVCLVKESCTSSRSNQLFFFFGNFLAEFPMLSKGKAILHESLHIFT